MNTATAEANSPLGGASQSTSAVRIRLDLFGNFKMSSQGVSLPLKSIKSSALLTFLALKEDGAERREKIAHLLWSKSDEEHARGSLRHVVRALNKIFEPIGFQGFDAGRDTIYLDQTLVDVDVFEVTRSAGRGIAHKRLLNVGAPFETLFSSAEEVDPEFTAWVRGRRVALAEETARSLEAAIESGGLLGENDPFSRRELSTAILNIEPSNENACRVLMLSNFLLHEPKAAADAYGTLWRVLDEEHATSPSEETQDLIERIKRRDQTLFDDVDDQLAPEPVKEGSQLIGVWVEPAPATGGEGIADTEGALQTIKSRLARFRDWEVFAGSPPATSTLVRRGAYRVRTHIAQTDDGPVAELTAEDVSDNRIVWGDSIPVGTGATDSGLIDRVANRIAVALRVHLKSDRLSRIATEPDFTIGVGDIALRSEALLANLKPSLERRSRGLLRKAIEASSDFAFAYAGLSQLEATHGWMTPGKPRSPAQDRTALRLARTATGLDPLDGRSNLAQAWAQLLCGQGDAAISSFVAACDLGGGDPWVVFSSALGLACAGISEGARQYHDQGMSAGFNLTTTHWSCSALTMFLVGDDLACIASAENAGAGTFAGASRAAAQHRLGRTKEAAASARAFVDSLKLRWEGPDGPTHEELARWFISVTPIIDPAVRDGFESHLSAALANVTDAN